MWLHHLAIPQIKCIVPWDQKSSHNKIRSCFKEAQVIAMLALLHALKCQLPFESKAQHSYTGLFMGGTLPGNLRAVG